MVDLIGLLIGMLLAAGGAAGYIVFWEEYDRKKAGRHLVLAGIGGIIYTILRQEYGYPDLIMTIVVGWWAPDFVQSIMERLRPEKPSAQPSGA